MSHKGPPLVQFDLVAVFEITIALALCLSIDRCCVEQLASDEMLLSTRLTLLVGAWLSFSLYKRGQANPVGIATPFVLAVYGGGVVVPRAFRADSVLYLVEYGLASMAWAACTASLARLRAIETGDRRVWVIVGLNWLYPIAILVAVSLFLAPLWIP
jgi:hypothetical protein